jgi:hypothetical protein
MAGQCIDRSFILIHVEHWSARDASLGLVGNRRCEDQVVKNVGVAKEKSDCAV